MANSSGNRARLIAASNWVAHADLPPHECDANWMARALRGIDAEPGALPSATHEAAVRTLDKLPYSLLAVSVKTL